MPISKEDKQKSRTKMLESACKLFLTQGFNAVTIEQVMEDAQLTRGAFYGHFSSKSNLYSEAIKFAIGNSKFVTMQDSDVSESIWLGELLDGYLSLDHINGNNPCPLAFLATDIVTRDDAAKQTYSAAYENINKVVLAYAQKHTTQTKEDILSLTAMIIGTVAIARTIDNVTTVKALLTNCRNDAGLKLGGI